MSNIPNDLKYTKSHEWVRLDNDGTAVIGVTDHAQELLGDIVYTELPEVGSQHDKASECAVVESVKAAADVYMPLSGEIVAVNDDLGDTPELINQDPYDKGWLFKIKLQKPDEAGELLDSDAYTSVAAEEH